HRRRPDVLEQQDPAAERGPDPGGLELVLPGPAGVVLGQPHVAGQLRRLSHPGLAELFLPLRTPALVSRVLAFCLRPAAHGSSGLAWVIEVCLTAKPTRS